MVLEPLLPEYQQRAPRVALMDRQGLEKALMFPTMGVTWEYELRHDVPTLYANLRSFNRWLEDEWGFGVDGRIYGVPLLSLFDLDRALTETHRLLEAGAKCINLRTGPVNGQSIAAPYFDPFWAILNEARIPVAFHICNSGYNDILSAAWGEVAEPNVREMSALQLAMTHCDRPMMDTLTACIMHNLFGRHPDLTVLSVEHGCGWVEYLLHALDHGAKMHRNGPWLGGPIDDRPSDIFKNHIKVNPFPEEDVLGLVRLLGAENVLFGSDYPHGEGINEPWEFTSSISTLADEEIHQIMRGNMDRIFASIA
jgi:predicted TIM-barrel fold metal-dependent hydrolase